MSCAPLESICDALGVEGLPEDTSRKIVHVVAVQVAAKMMANRHWPNLSCQVRFMCRLHKIVSCRLHKAQYGRVQIARQNLEWTKTDLQTKKLSTHSAPNWAGHLCFPAKQARTTTAPQKRCWAAAIPPVACSMDVCSLFMACQMKRKSK